MNEYTEDWKEYRRLRRMFFASWLLFPLTAMLASSVSFRLLRSPALGLIVAAIHFLWWMKCCWEFATFSCPRCGENFAGGKGLWAVNRGVLARKCAHCGLKKYAEYRADEILLYKKI